MFVVIVNPLDLGLCVITAKLTQTVLRRRRVSKEVSHDLLERTRAKSWNETKRIHAPAGTPTYTQNTRKPSILSALHFHKTLWYLAGP